MKKTVTIFLFIALFFAGAGFANQSKQQVLEPASISKANDENVATDLKLAQQKLEFFKERLDFQDKRIGDIGLYLTIFGSLFGILMTVIVVFFSLRIKREAVLEAKEEVGRQASPIIEAWLNNDGRQVLTGKVESLLKPEVEKALEDIRQAAASTLKELEKEREKAHEHNAKFGKILESIDLNKPLSSEQQQRLAVAAKDLESKPPKEYQFDDWLTLGYQADRTAKYEIAVGYFAKAAEIAANPVHQAKALGNKGFVLGQLNRREEAITVYDELVKRYGGAPEAALRELVAQSLVNKGVTLGELNRSAEAIVVYDEVVKRYGEAMEAVLRERVAKALVNKGVMLGQLNLSEEEIAVFNEVVNRYGEATEAALREQVATALVNKGIRLSQLNRSEEEIVVYDEVVNRYGEAPEAVLRERVGMALVNKGVVLNRLSRSEEAIAVCDEVVKRYGEAPEAVLRERVGMALVNKGAALDWLRRSEEAIAVCDEVVKRYGEAPEAALRELVVKALVNKGISLGQLSRREEAIAAYDEVVKRYGEAPETALREGVAKAKKLKAQIKGF